MDKLVEWMNKYAELHPSIMQVKSYGPQRTPRLNMAVVYAKNRSAERASASYLISSDSTPKNKLYGCICIRIDQYHQLRISDHEDIDALI